MADSINYQLAKFVASYGKVSQIPESVSYTHLTLPTIA